jgi:hippurate hydrolase
MEGTVRTYNETWRKDIHGKIEQISTGIARAMGAECDVHISGGYPSLYNNPEITNQLQQWAVEYLGDYFVADIPPRTTAEDFAYFAERVPSCLYRLGISNKEKGIGSNLHSANFNVDEESLKPGMELMAWFALNLLK